MEAESKGTAGMSREEYARSMYRYWFNAMEVSWNAGSSIPHLFW